MQLVTNLVDLNVSTLAIRELDFPDNELEAIFPTVVSETIDYKFGSTGRFNEATTVRAFDAPTPIIGGGTAVAMRGGLPAVSAMRLITESDGLRARRLVGISGAEELADTTNAALAQATLAVQNRYELFRGEAIATHQIVINENGIKQGVDFGVPAALRPTRAVAWSDFANADIIGELFAWMRVYVKYAGKRPGKIVTSLEVLYNMLRNAAVRALVSPTAAPTVITPEQLNQALGAYGLPPVTTYDREIDTGVMDADGEPIRQRVIPVGKLAMLPADGLGETQMGLTERGVQLAESNILTSDVAPGMVAVTFVNPEPVYKVGLVDSIGLPVIQHPREILTAQVL